MRLQKTYYLFFKFKSTLLIAIVFFGINSNAIAQSTKFDSIFYNTIVNSEDSDKALFVADSLYSNSTGKTNKIRSLMLSASIYNKKGVSSNALSYAVKAYLIAEKSSNYEWIAKISGFLSTQYRTLGLKEAGLSYLKKGKEAALRMDNKNNANLFLAVAYQEEAYYLIDEKKYVEVAKSLEEAGVLFNRLPDSSAKFFNLAANYELLGANNLKLSNTTVAENEFKESLMYLDKASAHNTALRGFVCLGLARVSIKNKNHELTKYYFSKAIEIANNTDVLSFKDELYKELISYYDTNGNTLMYKKYTKLYNEVLHKQSVEDKAGVNQIVSSLNESTESAFAGRMTYLFSILLVVVLFLAFTTKFFFKNKKNPEVIISNTVSPVSTLMNNSDFSTDADCVENSITSVNKKQNNTIVLSPEVEKPLLQKLAKFEKEEKYLNKNISVATLSNLLDTNSKYVSYIIKKHKGKDFSSYINNLRVSYIVEKMKSDPFYRQYKISHMAKECGFSSHSKFSLEFKAVTGVSPSEFIESIK